MKINHLFFLLFFLLLAVSCVQGDSGERLKKDTKKRESELATESKDGATINSAEEFDEFLNLFSLQESFQLNRIKFPLTATVPDADHEGMAPMEETIGKYDWEMLDLTYDSTYLSRPYDQYYQVVRFQNDSAVVEIRGINNGIYADYYFELIDNQWYLVSLYEASF